MPEARDAVQALPLPHLLYVRYAFALETLRAAGGCAKAGFLYLADPSLERERLGHVMASDRLRGCMRRCLWESCILPVQSPCWCLCAQHVSRANVNRWAFTSHPPLSLLTSPCSCHLQTAVADAAFRVFLARALRQGRSAGRDACLRDHALCFLAHTGHRYPRVRGVAYRHLVELLERFPHLLWDEAWCVLACSGGWQGCAGPREACGVWIHVLPCCGAICLLGHPCAVAQCSSRPLPSLSSFHF